MTKQMLLYGNAVPLNAEQHRDVSIRQTHDYAFAKELGAVPVVAAEFASAALEMPIVFAQTDDGLFPWAMMSLDTGSNTFVGENGTWSGNYIPAFVRRYPFVFASQQGNDTLTLCVDETHGALNRDGVGERLFDSEGNRTKYLQSMLDFSTEYQRQFLRTKQFVERLDGLGLFEPITASYTDAQNQTRRVAGFSRIKREALKAIPQDALTEMFSTDELELCFLHLLSLSNVSKVTPKRAADAAPAETETA